MIYRQIDIQMFRLSPHVPLLFEHIISFQYIRLFSSIPLSIEKSDVIKEAPQQ